jgi:hypothetical protein
MPFDWQIFLRIMLAFLRCLQKLPPDVDTTAIVGDLGDAIEANGIRTKQGDTPHG